ncbi:esterase [Colletotrichum plurivorum]|uniref:Esterase n=1 Tax=Colletotrichum plurivorum TaxID=2175906 RepID=A0A8H6KSZ1_9PEZI|nr:esterase [Colletotrichum plurivorum]
MDTPTDQSTTTSAPRLIVHERNERHILTRLVHMILKPFKPSLMKAGKLPPGAERLMASKRTKKLCDVAEEQVDGVWVYNITKKPTGNPIEKTDTNARRILYFAGGGWQMPPSKHHWAFCSELARRLPGKTRVTIVSCPLAPKSPVAVAFPQMERAYRSLLAESTRAGESVVVAGDSSGGNIALCLAAWALRFQEQKQGSKPPAAVFVLSPTTDLRHEMEAITRAERNDPIHTHQCIRETARAWCPEHSAGDEADDDDDDGGHAPRQLPGDWTFEDPRVSPIQADLSYLVRHGVSVHGLTGSYDVLEPEAVVFRDKCRDEGVAGEWLAWDGQMHGFPLTFRYGIRESKEAMDWIVGVLGKH